MAALHDCDVRGGCSVCPKPCWGTNVDDEVLNHEENETVRGERCVEFAARRNS